MALEEVGVSLVAEGADAFENTLNGINGVFESFGNIVADVASAATDALVSFFQDSFAGALEAEQTVARLGQVIESTGGIAGVTVDDAQALADQFKNLAGGSDDAVLSIIDMGLRMGTISEDEMPAFIQTTLDLGTVMGDASKAAQLMARAQEDPVGVLGALRKAGILVNEETEAQIKAMVKAGDTAGAYSLLMGRVGEATQGAAETMAETTAGQWTIFQETIADAGETIVGAFLPALNAIATPIINSVIPAVDALAATFSSVITSIIQTGDVFGNIGALADFPWEDIFPAPIADVIYNIIGAAEGVPAVLVSIQSAMQPVIDATANLADAFLDSMPMIQATVGVMIDFVIGQFETLSPTLIANVSSTLDSLATFWREHGDEIMAIVTIAFEFITVTIGTALTSISGIIAAALALINGDTEQATSILQSTFTTVMDNILSLVGTDLDTFVASWSGTFAMIDDIVDIGIAAVGNLILGGLQSAIEAAQTTLVGFSDLANAIIDAIVSSIQSGAADVVNAMLGMLQDAIDAAQAALGIHSPSTVAFKLIGAPFTEGIAKGIVAEIGKVDMAMGAITDSMVRPPMRASEIGASYAYHYNNSVTNNLSVHTSKPLTTITGEFATMQTLYGGAI